MKQVGTPDSSSKDDVPTSEPIAQVSADAGTVGPSRVAERQLGTFRRTIDLRRARLGALRVGLLVFAGLAGVSCGTRLPWFYAVAAAVIAVLAYVVRKRIAERAIDVGQIALRDDPREGRLLILTHRERAIHRIPLAEARTQGRKQTLPSVGDVRLQIGIAWPGGALLATLAVGYKPAPDDETGLLAASVELDRDASRAFDALSYELPAR